jgi:hypothetical protein
MFAGGGIHVLTWHLVPVLGLSFPVIGIASPTGKLVFAGFLVLALLFVVTNTENVTALWKPAVLCCASVAMFVFCIWQFTGGRHATETKTVNGETTVSSVIVPPGAGLHVTGVLAAVMSFGSATAIRVRGLEKSRHIRSLALVAAYC